MTNAGQASEPAEAHNCQPSCVPWIGTNKCHCSDCGMNFSVITHFDSHRPAGRCLNPESVGLEQNSYGVWVIPGEVDLGERFKRR